MNETVSHSDDHHENQRDFIELSGCGLTTRWVPPKRLTKCPVRQCHAEVEDRTEIITHYREKHARSSILCQLCNTPICSSSSKNFIQHYKRMHQNTKVPYDFGRRGNQSVEPHASTQVC